MRKGSGEKEWHGLQRNGLLQKVPFCLVEYALLAIVFVAFCGGDGVQSQR